LYACYPVTLQLLSSLCLPSCAILPLHAGSHLCLSASFYYLPLPICLVASLHSCMHIFLPYSIPADLPTLLPTCPPLHPAASVLLHGCCLPACISCLPLSACLPVSVAR
jgi:hypothetical protein